MGPSPDPPGDLYGPGARALQDRFDSRRLADRLVDITLHGELDAGDIELIREQPAVWVATVDPDGWPDLSYKGGEPGFVQVVDPGELRIPVYNGNGMWRTLGNVLDDDRVALLFIDERRPWRVRVHGRATVATDEASTAGFHGAEAVLVVRVARVFPNCGRYIHRGGELSPFVPREGHEPPVPEWKQLPFLNEVLPADDPARLPPEG
jgi:predicted pyridoxine 5'-phosphate oxidase superfamily flavin-nucleotide-binding protein